MPEPMRNNPDYHVGPCPALSDAQKDRIRKLIQETRVKLRTPWSNAIEDYTDENGVISGVPMERTGQHRNLCPICKRRIPSEALDDNYRHAEGCNWRQLVKYQRNFTSYGVRDPFTVENGKGKVKLTVTYELDVSFVSDVAFEKTVKQDFTDPNRAVALNVSGSIVSWKRRAGVINKIEWLERTEPKGA